jgi:hypothetical protein
VASMVITGILLTVGILYTLFFSSLFRIKTMQVQNRGTVITLSVDEIRDRFVDLYGQHMMFVDIETLLRSIIIDNPRIHTIEAKKVWPSTIIFSFFEYEILGSVQDPVSKEWYLVNQNSLIVERNLYEPPRGLVQITFVNEVNLENIDVVFSEEELDYMVSMMMMFHKNTGFPITGIAVNTVADEYTMENAQGWAIRTDGKYAPEQVISRLNALISTVDLGTTFQFIDLRIPNKAFVCYKDSGCQDSTPLTEEQ